MRTSDCEILIVPGFGDSPPDHWQSRWQAKLSFARRVGQADWQNGTCSDWAARIMAEVDAAVKPVILVTHSLGGIAAIHAAGKLPPGRISGAFLVAVPDYEESVADSAKVSARAAAGFTPLPKEPLSFPSIVVASSDDELCRMDRAQAFADAWGSEFCEAGDVGHLNIESGHGPWPEGLMRFGLFLKSLG